MDDMQEALNMSVNYKHILHLYIHTQTQTCIQTTQKYIYMNKRYLPPGLEKTGKFSDLHYIDITILSHDGGSYFST